MFHAKMNDEEDDELPGFDDEEEGQEQPQEIVEEVEEIVDRGRAGRRGSPHRACSRQASARTQSQESQEGEPEEKEGQGQAEEERKKGACEEIALQETQEALALFANARCDWQDSRGRVRELIHAASRISLFGCRPSRFDRPRKSKASSAGVSHFEMFFLP